MAVPSWKWIKEEETVTPPKKTISPPQPVISSPWQRAINKKVQPSQPEEAVLPLTKQEIMGESAKNWAFGLHEYIQQRPILEGEKNRIVPEQQYIMQEEGTTDVGPIRGWSKGQILTGTQVIGLYENVQNQNRQASLGNLKSNSLLIKQVRGLPSGSLFYPEEQGFVVATPEAQNVLSLYKSKGYVPPGGDIGFYRLPPTSYDVLTQTRGEPTANLLLGTYAISPLGGMGLPFLFAGGAEALGFKGSISNTREQYAQSILEFKQSKGEETVPYVSRIAVSPDVIFGIYLPLATLGVSSVLSRFAEPIAESVTGRYMSYLGSKNVVSVAGKSLTVGKTIGAGVALGFGGYTGFQIYQQPTAAPMILGKLTSVIALSSLGGISGSALGRSMAYKPGLNWTGTAYEAGILENMHMHSVLDYQYRPYEFGTGSTHYTDIIKGTKGQSMIPWRYNAATGGFYVKTETLGYELGEGKGSVAITRIVGTDKVYAVSVNKNINVNLDQGGFSYGKLFVEGQQPKTFTGISSGKETENIFGVSSDYTIMKGKGIELNLGEQPYGINKINDFNMFTKETTPKYNFQFSSKMNILYNSEINIVPEANMPEGLLGRTWTHWGGKSSEFFDIYKFGEGTGTGKIEINDMLLNRGGSPSKELFRTIKHEGIHNIHPNWGEIPVEISTRIPNKELDVWANIKMDELVNKDFFGETSSGGIIDLGRQSKPFRIGAGAGKTEFDFLSFNKVVTADERIVKGGFLEDVGFDFTKSISIAKTPSGTVIDTGYIFKMPKKVGENFGGGSMGLDTSGNVGSQLISELKMPGGVFQGQQIKTIGYTGSFPKMNIPGKGISLSDLESLEYGIQSSGHWTGMRTVLPISRTVQESSLISVSISNLDSMLSTKTLLSTGTKSKTFSIQRLLQSTNVSSITGTKTTQLTRTTQLTDVLSISALKTEQVSLTNLVTIQQPMFNLTEITLVPSFGGFKTTPPTNIPNVPYIPFLPLSSLAGGSGGGYGSKRRRKKGSRYRVHPVQLYDVLYLSKTVAI